MVAEVADLHFQAFAGQMNTRMGRGYICSFIDWFCRQKDGIALMAVRDGALAGYVVGAPDGYRHEMFRDLSGIAAYGMLKRPWVLLNIRFLRQAISALLSMAGARTDTPTVPGLAAPTMCLVAIGVTPMMRGRGIAQTLMTAFESEARKRGARSLRLTVYRDNQAARTLYEKCRWIPHTSSGKDVMRYSIGLQSRPIKGIQDESRAAEVITR